MAGLGRAREGAGKLEQFRKVPKIPTGGGAGGGGPGNDATGHTLMAGGALARHLAPGAGGHSAEGEAASPRKPSLGGWSPLPS